MQVQYVRMQVRYAGLHTGFGMYVCGIILYYACVCTSVATILAMYRVSRYFYRRYDTLKPISCHDTGSYL